MIVGFIWILLVEEKNLLVSSSLIHPISRFQPPFLESPSIQEFCQVEDGTLGNDNRVAWSDQHPEQRG